MRCFDAARHALALLPLGFFVACGGATRDGVGDGGVGATTAAGAATSHTGGAPGAGAAVSSGGTRSTGGTVSSGGARSTGGTVSTGGIMSTGGTVSTGGIMSTGGVYSTGGSPTSTGGSPGGGNPSVYARDFDQSCKYDSDCAVVSEGNLCDCDACGNAGINIGALSKWDASLQNSACDSIPPCAPALCPEMVPACAKGTCTARPDIQLDTKSYNHDCKIDSDCVLIGTRVCAGGCNCGADAVSKTGYEEYQKAIAGIECTPSPVVCDCASPTKAICVASVSGNSACQPTF
jgi:hypothetical protein